MIYVHIDAFDTETDEFLVDVEERAEDGDVVACCQRAYEKAVQALKEKKK